MRTIALADNCVDIYYKIGIFYSTGNSINFAINYKSLGGDVTCMTILGNDMFADALESLLAEYEISLHVLMRIDKPTAQAKMNIIDGDRVHELFVGNALDSIEFSEFDLKRIMEFDIVYCERWARIERYVKSLKRQNQIWVYDFAKHIERQENLKIFPYIDYAFFSDVHDSTELRDKMKYIHAKGAKNVIAMIGSEGSVSFDGSRYFKQDAVPVKVSNTVGAGDSYIGAFTYGLSLGKRMEECMAMGCEQATKIIQIFKPYE